jgi:hypothetical protein
MGGILAPLAGLEPATQGLGIQNHMVSSNRGKCRFHGVKERCVYLSNAHPQGI